MTEEKKVAQESLQRHGGTYAAGALLIAITILINILFTGAIAYGIKSTTGGSKPVEGVLVSGVREFKMTAQQWYYSPNIFKANPGDAVQFSVASQDIRHGFAINELGINLALSSAGAVLGQAVIPSDIPSGTYTLYCSIFCGIGHPYMKGTIRIGEPGFEINKFLPYFATLVMAGVFVGFTIVRRREIR